MHWDDEYGKNKRLWGENPSEPARAAVAFMKNHGAKDGPLSILDIGCGYGRDAFFYADNLDCEIMGIDLSKKAIEIASKTAIEERNETVRFRRCDFAEFEHGEYDMVSASNLYQLLRQNEREALRKAVMRLLKRGGLFFLSTLSMNDPEHHGKGAPVPGEPNSFSYQDKVYLHFCTEEELAADFAFLEIAELYEREYEEPRANGEVHHHISWILIGEMASQ